MVKKDYKLDFLRGLAAIFIIIIHTVCKSGSSYVPDKILTFSLAVDVPIFIFISGMCFNYQKSLIKVANSLIKLYKNWLKFIFIYFFITLLFNSSYFSVENVISSLFFKFYDNSTFYVVKESMWFMPMFFLVSIFSSFLINKAEYNNFNIFKLLFLIFIFYGLFSFYINLNSNLAVEILFYTFIYVLGYIVYKYKYFFNKKNTILFFIFSVLINLFIFKFSSINFFDMPNIKFRFEIYYLIYSSMSFCFSLILYNFLNIKNNNKLVWLGQNAIFCYFAQGISSSLMNYIVPFYHFLKPPIFNYFKYNIFT